MSMQECYPSYREVFLFSTWGDPSRWEKREYFIACLSGDEKRKLSAGEFFSATGALKNMLKSKKTEIIVFVQDTLLLNAVKERSLSQERIWSSSQGTKKRRELFALIMRYLRGVEAYKELVGEGRKEDYFVILPGMASYSELGYLFNWRGNDCYDFIVGGMLAHALKRLRQAQENRVAVFFDTSHGVNYFALALKEAIPLACSLHTIGKALSEYSDYNLHLYHYNSQPLIEEPSGKPSIALELVSSIEMKFQRREGSYRNNGVFFDILRMKVENTVSARGFENTCKSLMKRVQWISSWDKILASGLLFMRGILPWALRIAKDLELSLDKILDEISTRLEDVSVLLERKAKNPVENTATYRWKSAEALEVDAALLALLAATLREAADNLLSPCSTRHIDDARRVLEEYAAKPGDQENLSDTLSLLNELKESCLLMSLAKITGLAEKVYSKPFSVIAQTETERVRESFELKPEKAFGQVEKLPQGDLRVKCENFQVLIPAKKKSLDERDFYAHLGLVRGTAYSAIRTEDDYALLLGPYSTILDALKQWHV
ncbi:MAG: hypothetical protein LM590_08080 [Thermofilum sp.]|jgi:CRISPR-associated protein Csx1|nr:hypothetical protein [Thermofilum sp.]